MIAGAGAVVSVGVTVFSMSEFPARSAPGLVDPFEPLVGGSRLTTKESSAADQQGSIRGPGEVSGLVHAAGRGLADRACNFSAVSGIEAATTEYESAAG